VRARHGHSGALIFILASVACSHFAQSQVASTTRIPAGAAHLSDADKGLIKLDVVVTDNSGTPVSGLEPKDFALSENSQPNPIVSLQSFDSSSTKPDPPSEIILVVDTIGMPDSVAYFQWREVDKFLRQNSTPHSQLSIFHLSENGLRQIAQPSTNPNTLEKNIAHPNKGSMVRRPPYISSPGLAALKAIGFIATAERPKPGRKLLIWIGMPPNPGESSHDQQYLFNAIIWFSTLMRDARVVLYSIYADDLSTPPFFYKDYLQGIPSASFASLADLAVPVLAIQSGGRMLVPGDLAKQLNSCIEDAPTFYELSFNPLPAAHPDEYHPLTIHIDKPGLSARTRTGYYDQPYYTDQPYRIVRQITVSQLQQLLKDTNHKSDSDIARQLSDLELTERLSSASLSSWLNTIHGKKTRQALIAMADLSAFLNPPPAEIAPDPPPDINAQGKLVSSAIAYLRKTIPQLPNLFATRATVLYVENPPQYVEAGKAGIDYQPLRPASISTAAVQVRDGKEVVDASTTKKKNQNTRGADLAIQGTFGPILVTVIEDALALQSTLTWSRWERNADHLYAVFRYSVPTNRSHFSISNCCLADGDGTTAFQMQAPYLGEIAIDPATSAIIRLSLVASLKPGLPLNQSNTMVEYGPVDIAGKSYIVPLRSVSISRAQTVRPMQLWDESFRAIGPYATTLDDTVFTDYHLFRSSSRVLPGFNPVP
jgi:VWFA-related protein